jgi:predicted transcriptional regulator
MMAIVGKTMQQIRAESAARRQSILNSRAYREGERINNSEAAKIMKCNPRAVYHYLDEMIKLGQLQSHKHKHTLTYSKPGVDWARISWRSVSNDELLLDESLGSL